MSTPNKLALTTGTSDNAKLLDELHRLATLKAVDLLAIEQVTHYGMAVGKDVFETVFWAGRFAQAWSGDTLMVPRKDVMLKFCGSARAKDTNLRQALIDQFGGDQKAIGGVRCQGCKGKGWRGKGRPTCMECGGEKWLHPPGPLHTVRGHEWAAIGVAMFALSR